MPLSGEKRRNVATYELLDWGWSSDVVFFAEPSSCHHALQALSERELPLCALGDEENRRLMEEEGPAPSFSGGPPGTTTAGRPKL
eukprot:COSAG04_NODE_1695_length_5903_cov_8.707099_4_plen_85_part_00